jgi:cytochrome c oxidase subunit 3
MTFILITSSMTRGTAVTAARLGDRKKALNNLVFTIVGGFCFLGCQAYEWSHFIHEGARLTSNPWGAPQFAASFFILTGFHGSHVLSGVTILTITAIRTAMGKTQAQGVEMAGLYWHFVDLVWVFIFTLYYLL